LKIGNLIGGSGGSEFDDSHELSLIYSDRCKSVKISWSADHLESVCFVYSTHRPGLVHGGENGRYASPLREIFRMNADEEIETVNVIIREVPLQVLDMITKVYNDVNVTIIVGIQFSTNRQRTTKIYGSSDGRKIQDRAPFGYTFGYARGRSGLFVDALQFVWYEKC